MPSFLQASAMSGNTTSSSLPSEVNLLEVVVHAASAAVNKMQRVIFMIVFIFLLISKTYITNEILPLHLRLPYRVYWQNRSH